MATSKRSGITAHDNFLQVSAAKAVADDNTTERFAPILETLRGRL
jgi:hypothetical protein